MKILQTHKLSPRPMRRISNLLYYLSSFQILFSLLFIQYMLCPLQPFRLSPHVLMFFYQFLFIELGESFIDHEILLLLLLSQVA